MERFLRLLSFPFILLALFPAIAAAFFYRRVVSPLGAFLAFPFGLVATASLWIASKLDRDVYVERYY